MAAAAIPILIEVLKEAPVAISAIEALIKVIEAAHQKGVSKETTTAIVAKHIINAAEEVKNA